MSIKIFRDQVDQAFVEYFQQTIDAYASELKKTSKGLEILKELKKLEAKKQPTFFSTKYRFFDIIKDDPKIFKLVIKEILELEKQIRKNIKKSIPKNIKKIPFKQLEDFLEGDMILPRYLKDQIRISKHSSPFLGEL